ncbi:hypothetical protein AO371_0243 [Moraxella catarrhalis]|nr:hypothetical protein AO371_0243 [Moraxella catarrhalis]
MGIYWNIVVMFYNINASRCTKICCLKVFVLSAIVTLATK